MTTRKHLKRLVRHRAALTGESYATALRTVRRTRQEQEKEMPTLPDTTPANRRPDIIASCSFCGKPNTDVRRLVAGPGVFICNECVELSATVIADTPESTPEEAAVQRERSLHRPADEILGLLPALGRSLTRLEADVTRWVGRLRSQGTDWSAIAEALGIDEPETRRRFGGAGD